MDERAVGTLSARPDTSSISPVHDMFPNVVTCKNRVKGTTFWLIIVAQPLFPPTPLMSLVVAEDFEKVPGTCGHPNQHPLRGLGDGLLL